MASKEEYRQIRILHGQDTPKGFLISLFEDVFGFDGELSGRLAGKIKQQGDAVCGEYPLEEAKVKTDNARKLIREQGHDLKLRLKKFTPTGKDRAKPKVSNGKKVCSFCGRTSDEVDRMFTADRANICNECVERCGEKLSDKSDESFKYSNQLINWQFDALQPEQISTSSRLFPTRMRADLQLVLDRLWIPHATRIVGINSEYQHEAIGFPSLMKKGRYPKMIAPLQYEDVDVGEADPVKCLKNALILLREDDVNYAILVSPHTSYNGQAGINIEVAVPGGEAGAKIVRDAFKQIEEGVNAARSYRGKVLSLENAYHYTGESSGIAVHKLDKVTKDQIILPPETLELLDRNIVQFAGKRERLRSLGMSSKKGLLFYGPPGTGKTHTIHYLANCMPTHTTLLITAEQVGLLGEYFTLARLLQPTILVIEDVDLIARDRTSMDSACEEVLLNKLLNEMDGFREDADIFFVLTTNRPETLEAALASRPGRIDQAIEFPLPDADARQRLIKLYAHELKVPLPVSQAIIERTDGVSASFIKELMRRAAQYYIESTNPKSLRVPLKAGTTRYEIKTSNSRTLSLEDVQSALDEMLLSGNKLNVTLLGGNSELVQA